VTTNEDLRDEAFDIANDIERVCEGRNTAAVYMAISAVIGMAAAKAEKPDFDGLLRLIEQSARNHFDRERRGWN
jgi:hypothetical protein